MIPRSYHNTHLTPQYRLAQCQADYTEADIARFWVKVDRAGQEGCCWRWLASSMDAFGHGQFTTRRNGKQFHLYAHRVVWELTRGPIPDGLFVLHNCPTGDNPRCVNPDHLWLGTQADNLEDARQKGRLVESQPRTKKLTPAERLAIYQTPDRYGICVELAIQFGVTKSCISTIRRGRFAGSPLKPIAARAQHRQRLSHLEQQRRHAGVVHA